MDWKPNTFRLFISHVSANHVFAQELATQLNDHCGISCFVAHEDINPDTEWQDEIKEALNSMDGLLAILSDGFSQSTWCNQEIGWALGAGKVCVSLRAGEDPPGFAGRLQALRMGDGNPLRIAREIFDILAKNEKTAERLAITTSLNLLHAPTWEHINDVNFPCLKSLTVFPEEALDNIERSFDENWRMEGAFKAGEIRPILKKHRA